MEDKEAAPDSAIDILLVGVDGKAAQFLMNEFRKLDTSVQFTICAQTPEFESSFDKWEDGVYASIFAGASLDGVSGTEIAQTLLNQCPNTNRFYVTSSLDGFEPRLLIKNGFAIAFGLPQDSEILRQTMRETILYGKRIQRVYKPVRVQDIESGGQLDFPTYVYLPLNDRYVNFSRPEKPLTKEKIDKLNQKAMTQVFVEKKDMQKFYQYTASRLRDAGGGQEVVSATERREKLNGLVRGLFTDIFDASVKADFEAGKEMINQTEKIISNYITKGATSNWYKKLLSTIGESQDGYSHAGNVSTLAALFAIGIGHPHPEDLAMAGLFHDLGLQSLPAELQEKEIDAMTPQELELYSTHPERSINYVKMKRIILTPPVEKAILQHHERWDGKGFPKKFSTVKLSNDAQILSFSDQFDDLTRVRPGRERMTPLEAWQEIKLNHSINPELMGQIKRLLEPK